MRILDQKPKMRSTRLEKLKINKFRALNDVEIEFGNHITVICGKNGTSKSSILGIAAQIFSFDKDYTTEEKLNFSQITGAPFKSQYKDHFRISNKFDTPGSMKVDIELFDGYSEKTATAKLELIKRRESTRAVVRNNSTASSNKNDSRNFTHPVIFLSLKRLYPIVDREYKVIDYKYLKDHYNNFIQLTNELLNRNSSQVTGTGGTIQSAVAHDKNYDQDSVSTGEDNAGQIILALMSFRKIKEEYPNYKGGLLLIDEADAGLFPTAQVNLLNILERECKNLSVQVIMTSHSPTIIEHIFRKSQLLREKYRIIYLSDTYGNIQVMQDWSYEQVIADINTKTLPVTESISLPRINVYFEDKEAEDFFKILMNRQSIKKFVKLMSGINLGCLNYKNLIDHKIAEFSEKSIICLDPDAIEKFSSKKYKTIIFLPGKLPPDQLIFEYLYNLPADNNFWKNSFQFTRSTFTNKTREIVNFFDIKEDIIDLNNIILSKYKILSEDQKKNVRKPREIFKDFYKENDFQGLLKSREYNPWLLWIKNNPIEVNKFLNNFHDVIYNIMKSSYNVDIIKLNRLKNEIKKTR